MKKELITLSKERNVTLTCYLIENSCELQNGMTRPMVIICPGGGYSYLSDREADPIAYKYLAAGFHAAVLRYGVGEYAVAPGPLKDAAQAVAYVRDHAKEWLVDHDAVYIEGFSAGGHVACQLGVFWNNAELLPEYAENPGWIRPNGMILGYPVIDLTKSVTHMDIGIQPGADIRTIQLDQKHPKMPLEKIFVMDPEEGRYFVDFEQAMNAFIFDGEFTPEQEEFYCLQNRVNEETCPAFIFHCSGDGLILPDNSLELAAALTRYGVSAELHLYDGGGHGGALFNYITANDRWQDYPYAADWIDRSIEWILQRTNFVQKIRDRF